MVLFIKRPVAALLVLIFGVILSAEVLFPHAGDFQNAHDAEQTTLHGLEGSKFVVENGSSNIDGPLQCSDPCHYGHCHFGHCSIAIFGHTFATKVFEATELSNAFRHSVIEAPDLDGLLRPPRPA